MTGVIIILNAVPVPWSSTIRKESYRLLPETTNVLRRTIMNFLCLNYAAFLKKLLIHQTIKVMMN